MEYKKVIVVIPARNEGKTLPTTLQALLEQKYPIEGIFIANDGSTDNTREVALSYDKVFVTDIEDRGYDAVGKAVLANTFNAGFKIAIEKIPDYDYLLIVGADTVLPLNYIDKLLEEFKNNPLAVMLSGNIPDDSKKTKGKVEIRGTGRMIKRSFWKEINEQYPINVGWESYPIFKARQMGFEVYGIGELEMKLQRPTGKNTDYHAYGLAMKSFGYFFPIAIGRSLKQLFLRARGIKPCINMARGYLFGKTEKYEVEIRNFVNKSQKRRLRKLIFRF